jgi:hypothetical protein
MIIEENIDKRKMPYVLFIKLIKCKELILCPMLQS